MIYADFKMNGIEEVLFMPKGLGICSLKHFTRASTPFDLEAVFLVPFDLEAVLLVLFY